MALLQDMHLFAQMRGWPRCLLPLGLLVTALSPGRTAAQALPGTSPNLTFGIGYLSAHARGGLNDALGTSQGASGYLAYPLTRRGWLAVRLDLSLVAPNEDVARFPLVIQGTPADVRVNTTSNFASAFVGPQLSARLGPLRPYAHGAVGITRFVYDLFASATLTGGGTRSAVITTGSTRLGAQVGAGLRIPLVRRSGSVMLDAGVLAQRGGTIDVPLQGTLGVDADGAITATTARAALSFYSWRAGIAVAF